MAVVKLLRHAESKFNAGTNTDQLDVGITERGKQQAARVSGHYDLVVCSTLRRTKQTLEHSQITYNKLIFLHEAREQKKLIWKCNFLPGEEIYEETNTEMMHRMLTLKGILGDLCKSHEDVLMVCHGYVCKFITATNVEEILKHNADPNGTRPENCGFVKLYL